MHNPQHMLDEVEGVSKVTKKRDVKAEAKKFLYKTKKGRLYVPARALKGCLIQAAAYKKAGKFALRPLLAAGIRVDGSEILLNTNKYELDLRTVVIQRQRVVKARPKIKNWKLNFKLIINDDLIAPDIIRTVLEEAGERVGILDFRPQKLGEFGTFRVTKFANGDKK